MVQFWPLNVLKAHADGNQLVPGFEGLGLEEVGSIIGREGLVDCEGCDFGGDCRMSVDEGRLGGVE